MRHIEFPWCFSLQSISLADVGIGGIVRFDCFFLFYWGRQIVSIASTIRERKWSMQTSFFVVVTLLNLTTTSFVSTFEAVVSGQYMGLFEAPSNLIIKYLFKFPMLGCRTIFGSVVLANVKNLGAFMCRVKIKNEEGLKFILTVTSLSITITRTSFCQTADQKSSIVSRKGAWARMKACRRGPTVIWNGML